MYQSRMNQFRVARQDRASNIDRRKRWQKLAPPSVGVEALEKRRLLTGDITGKVYHDVNLNGNDDPEENGLSGWTIFVDTDGDGLLTSGEPTTVSDTDGDYIFAGLPPGTLRFLNVDPGPYRVVEIVEPGWEVTRGTHSAGNVTVFTAVFGTNAWRWRNSRRWERRSR